MWNYVILKIVNYVICILILLNIISLVVVYYILLGEIGIGEAGETDQIGILVEGEGLVVVWVIKLLNIIKCF